MYEKPLEFLYRIIKNRLFVFLGITSFAFLYLVNALFYLQIIEGETFQENLNQNIAREIIIPAPRGNIYDRFGRPLATNQSAFSVKIDPSIPLPQDELNLVLLNLINLLEKNEEDYVDTLPITLEPPYEFTFTGSNAERQKELWKNSLNLSHDLNADETMEALKEFFKINEMSPDVTEHEARMIISLRANLYTQRFLRFNPVTIAMNVSKDTVTVIEEENERFNSIFIDTEALRYYPGEHYFSHIIGYIGPISDTDDIDSLLSRGYRRTDVIGKTALELSFEEELRGIDGVENVIVNNVGRRVGVIEGSRVEPIPGDSIFLSVDKDFNMQAYDILENILTETIINMLTKSSTRESRLTVQTLLSSLTRANNISAKDIFESEEGTVSYQVKQYVLSVNPEADASSRAGRAEINGIIADGISAHMIRPADILLVMHEQEIITGDENFVRNLQTGAISPLQVVIDKMREGEITPHMTNLDPSTGSVIVVDVHTGEVLASVSYPSYDNNELVNNFNNEYYTRLLFDDPTNPLINRPFMEQRPPGSTFKMISGITAVESGVITPSTRIYDGVTFTRAGQPYPSSWSNISMGHIALPEALERSSNYFFFDAIYRIGNSENGNSRDSIDALNKYMIAFGLNEPSGVEIGEAFSNTNTPTNIASPELHDFLYRNANINARNWTDGDTIRVAIGQSINNYTAANMVKYTAGLATRGEMYNLRLLKSIASQEGVYHAEPVPYDMGVEIADSTWDATHEGMRRTIVGANGTASSVFNNFPIQVAGKTGTAQQNTNRRSHTSFNAFAPYDDPQIAVYVVIPFSDTATTPAPAAQVGRDVIAAYFKLDEEPERPLSTNELLM